MALQPPSNARLRPYCKKCLQQLWRDKQWGGRLHKQCGLSRSWHWIQTDSSSTVSLNHLLGFRWQVQSKTAEKNQGSRKGSTTSGMLWQNPASGSGRCGSNVCHTQTATCQVCSPPTLHTKALHLSSKSWILLKVSQVTLNGRPTWKRASFYCIGRSQSWANWETKQSNTFKPPINESAAE